MEIILRIEVTSSRHSDCKVKVLFFQFDSNYSLFALLEIEFHWEFRTRGYWVEQYRMKQYMINVWCTILKLHRSLVAEEDDLCYCSFVCCDDSAGKLIWGGVDCSQHSWELEWTILTAENGDSNCRISNPDMVANLYQGRSWVEQWTTMKWCGKHHPSCFYQTHTIFLKYSHSFGLPFW